MEISNVITHQCFQGTQNEKNSLPFAFQGDADIDKAENEPLGHTAVQPASRKKDQGKQYKQKHHRSRCPCIDTFLPRTRINTRATMLIPMTSRNMRSRRLILWSKMISSHFLIIQTPAALLPKSRTAPSTGIPAKLFLYRPAMLSQTSAYICSRTG